MLAIPRGAVPMGKVVADALDGELDVVLVRKLRAPQNPELAIGSIDEVGTVYLDPHLRDLWTDVYLEGEKQRQLQTLRQRREAYGRTGPPIDAGGRVVIVLDDGIATGSTMIAALRVRTRTPSRQGDCRDGSGISGDAAANRTRGGRSRVPGGARAALRDRCAFPRFLPGLR